MKEARSHKSSAAIGNTALLDRPKVALLCSRACPGSVILRTLDAIRAICGTARVVVSGFQSPTERECLDVLLRAEHPVIVCPARSVETMRIPGGWKRAVAADRMLVTSPFGESARRATAALAEERNRFVVSMSDTVLIPHAAPGGALERLCRGAWASTKPVWTIDDPSNQELLAAGARPLALDRAPWAIVDANQSSLGEDRS